MNHKKYLTLIAMALSGSALSLSAQEAPAVIDVEAMQSTTTSADNVSAEDIDAISQDISLELPTADMNTDAVTMGDNETISVDFPDEEVRTIIRNVADLYDLNVVIPDSLIGSTSIKLRNVTWQQVFDVVLEPFGFTYLRENNIIKIKSIVELAQEPLDIYYVEVEYADAEEISKRLDPILDKSSETRKETATGKGSLLILNVAPSNYPKYLEYVSAIDQPDKETLQVQIEAKFIEIQDIDNNNQGVNWNDTMQLFNATAGYNERITTGDWDTATTFAANVTNPVTSGMYTSVFTQTAASATLNILKQKAGADIVSNPSIVAKNGEKALLQIVTEVPIFSGGSPGSANEPAEAPDLEYRDVGLSLNVTPRVIGKELIKLKFEKGDGSDYGISLSRIGSDRTQNIAGLSNTAPQFDTRGLNTSVILNRDQTLAIGGLISNDKTETTERVPLLGDIPLLGKAFTNTRTVGEKRNLIIFLTAQQIDPLSRDMLQSSLNLPQANRMGISYYDIPGITPLTSEEYNALRTEQGYEAYRDSGGKLSKEEWFLNLDAMMQRTHNDEIMTLEEVRQQIRDIKEEREELREKMKKQKR